MSEFWKAVEAKVKAAALGALVVSLLLALLNALVGNSELLGSLPAWLQFVIVACAPTLVTFLAGWKARHEARPPVSVLPHLRPATPPAGSRHTAAGR